jgi:hypothetical protein
MCTDNENPNSFSGSSLLGSLSALANPRIGFDRHDRHIVIAHWICGLRGVVMPNVITTVIDNPLINRRW